MEDEEAELHAHDETDGCICDLTLGDDEVTSDEDLPIATGGVDTEPDLDSGDESTDGCDLDFNEGQLTPDEDLPFAVGGD